MQRTAEALDSFVENFKVRVLFEQDGMTFSKMVGIFESLTPQKQRHITQNILIKTASNRERILAEGLYKIIGILLVRAPILYHVGQSDESFLSNYDYWLTYLFEHDGDEICRLIKVYDKSVPPKAKSIIYDAFTKMIFPNLKAQRFWFERGYSKFCDDLNLYYFFVLVVVSFFENYDGLYNTDPFRRYFVRGGKIGPLAHLEKLSDDTVQSLLFRIHDFSRYFGFYNKNDQRVSSNLTPERTAITCVEFVKLWTISERETSSLGSFVSSFIGSSVVDKSKPATSKGIGLLKDCRFLFEGIDKEGLENVAKFLVEKYIISTSIEESTVVICAMCSSMISSLPLFVECIVKYMVKRVCGFWEALGNILNTVEEKFPMLNESMYNNICNELLDSGRIVQGVKISLLRRLPLHSWRLATTSQKFRPFVLKVMKTLGDTCYDQIQNHRSDSLDGLSDFLILGRMIMPVNSHKYEASAYWCDVIFPLVKSVILASKSHHLDSSIKLKYLMACIHASFTEMFRIPSTLDILERSTSISQFKVAWLNILKEDISVVNAMKENMMIFLSKNMQPFALDKYHNIMEASPIYLGLNRGFGAFCFHALTLNSAHRSDMAKDATQISVTILTYHKHRNESISEAALSFICSSAENILDNLRCNRFEPVSRLKDLYEGINWLLENSTSGNDQFDYLLDWRNDLKEIYQQLSYDSQSSNFRKYEIQSLLTRSEISLDSLREMINLFRYETQMSFEEFMSCARRDDASFIEEERNISSLLEMIDFLDGRGLLGGSIIPAKDHLIGILTGHSSGNDMTLASLQLNRSVCMESIGFDERMHEEEIRALKTFSRNSRLFLKHFNTASVTIFPNRMDVTPAQIVEAVKSSVDQLKKLVLNNDIRITQFEIDLNLIRQVQVDERYRDNELRLIADYFRSDSHLRSNFGSDTILRRLICSFELNIIYSRIGELLTSLNYLKLNRLSEAVEQSRVYNDLKRVNGDFKIADSPNLLNDFNAVISNLSMNEIEMIISIGASNFSVILDFFHKQGDGFSTALDDAKVKACRDPRVTDILQKLENIRPMLQPFWRRDGVELIFTFQILKSHFADSIRIENDIEHSDMLADIKETLEFFPDVLEYFMEDSEGRDIVSRASKYLGGQYMSELSSSHEGPSLYLIVGRFNRHIDEATLLENIQYAKLGTSTFNSKNVEDDSKILEIFVTAYELAKSIHISRLTLESSGHPDYQSETPFAISYKSDDHVTHDYARNLVNHLDLQRRNIDNELNRWQEAFESTTNDRCPRLRVLTFKARVQFLLAVRKCNTSIDENERYYAILPFLVQCFPYLKKPREEVIRTLRDVLNAPSLAKSSKDSSKLRSDAAIENLESAQNLLNSFLSQEDNALLKPCPVLPIRVSLQHQFECDGPIALFANHWLICEMSIEVKLFLVWCFGVISKPPQWK